MHSIAQIRDDRAALDRRLLFSGATFTTAQRAFMARSLLQHDLEGLDPETRAYLAVQAFEQYMLAGEDSLHWVFALMDWQPDGADMTSSLVARIDRVAIGSDKYQESGLIARLQSMTDEGFGTAIKVPPGVAMPDEVEHHEEFLHHWRAGLLRIANGRLADERAMVRAFNKAKHGLLALFDPAAADGPTVDLITSRDYTEIPVAMGRARVRALPLDIRRRVEWTLQIQAVLQGILTVVLGAQFGLWVPTPDWVKEVVATSVWYEEVPGAAGE